MSSATLPLSSVANLERDAAMPDRQGRASRSRFNAINRGSDVRANDVADDDELGWFQRSEAGGAVAGEEVEAHWKKSLFVVGVETHLDGPATGDLSPPPHAGRDVRHTGKQPHSR